jgi:hypothetical protein
MLRFALALMISCGIASGSANACVPANINPSRQEVLAQASASVREAKVIADVEVERVFRLDQIDVAVLRALKVWRGIKAERYFVFMTNGCDIGYWAEGYRHRILLDGGPFIFSAPMFWNGPPNDLQGVFDSEVDRILGENRPLNFKRPNTEEEVILRR